MNQSNKQKNLETIPYNHSHLIFNKGAKNTYLTNDAGKIGYPKVEN
jgi:hypothetical protein